MSNYDNLKRLNTLLDLYSSKNSKPGYDIIDGVKCEVRFVIITPELAEALLENFNNHNRPMSEVNLKVLTKEMLTGSWVFNGESITFDYNGNCTNGQHRLKAIVITGLSFRFLVASAMDSFQENKGQTMDLNAGIMRSPALLTLTMLP